MAPLCRGHLFFGTSTSFLYKRKYIPFNILMSHIRLTILFSLLHFTLYAQVRKDTIFFNNGSLVVGQLKKIRLGVVTFDPDDANDITVQQRKVRGLSARSEVFRIETIRKKLLYGVIRPDTVPQFVKVGYGASIETLHVEEIFNAYPFSDKFMQNFSGSVGLGYSYTRSSGFGRFNIDGNLQYRSKRHEVAASLSGIYSQTDTGFTRDREDLSIRDNYYFSPASFITGFIAYQKNREIGLKRRFQEGLGIGNKFVTSKSLYAWARTGLVLNQEQSLEGKNSGLLTEGFAQLQFNVFRFTKPEVNLNFRQTFFVGITEAGRFRTDGQVDLSWEMINDLKLSLQFYNNYDSRPPTAGVSRFDYGIIFGIKYTWQ